MSVFIDTDDNKFADMVNHITAFRAQNASNEKTTQEVLAGYRSELANTLSELATARGQIESLESQIVLQIP